MEDTPTYGVVLVAEAPTALSYEQLVQAAATQVQALGTYYLAMVSASDHPAYQARSGGQMPAHARYTVQVWDTRTANFSQPCGLCATQASGDTPAEALANLKLELHELEYSAERHIDAQVEQFQQHEAYA